MTEFEQVITRLADFPDELQALLADTAPEALFYQPGPEEWSIVQVIGHLEDVDAMTRSRVELALTRNNPTVPVYAEKGPVQQRDFQQQPFEQVLEAFLVGRASFVAMLRALRPEDLTCTVQHPMHGTMTVTRIPSSLPKHDQTHRAQIAANLAHYTQTGVLQ